MISSGDVADMAFLSGRLFFFVIIGLQGQEDLPYICGSIPICCRYYTDPSGTFWQCNAKAIGSGSEGADSSLQEQYNKVRFVRPLS